MTYMHHLLILLGRTFLFTLRLEVLSFATAAVEPFLQELVESNVPSDDFRLASYGD